MKKNEQDWESGVLSRVNFEGDEGFFKVLNAVCPRWARYLLIALAAILGVFVIDAMWLYSTFF